MKFITFTAVPYSANQKLEMHGQSSRAGSFLFVTGNVRAILLQCQPSHCHEYWHDWVSSTKWLFCHC